MDNDYYKIKVNDLDIIVDGIKYEYSQQDKDEAGRSDDYTMTRDVAGLLNKIYCDMKDRNNLSGETLDNILSIVDLTECQFNYYDLRKKKRLTKPMYIVFDPIEVDIIDNEPVAKEFQIRFIQMDIDEVR